MIKITLPSAFELVAFHRFGDDDGLVLVHLVDNRATPYASYRIQRSTGACHWGHYIHTANEAAALDAFYERLNDHHYNDYIAARADEAHVSGGR